MASATDHPPAQASSPPHPAPTDIEKEAIVEENSKGLKKVLDEKLLKHSHDADAAMKAFEGMEGQVVELTEEKSKALLRKIDMHMMPVSSFLHFCDIRWSGLRRLVKMS
jgi:ACS family allantoate permease-like MFS transporter